MSDLAIFAIGSFTFLVLVGGLIFSLHEIRSMTGDKARL